MTTIVAWCLTLATIAGCVQPKADDEREAKEQIKPIVPLPKDEPKKNDADNGGIAPKIMAEFTKLRGHECGSVWDHDTSLSFTFLPDPGAIPSLMFVLKKGETLPPLPDADVPFGLRLHGEGIDDRALKNVASLKNLSAIALLGTKVTDDGLKELSKMQGLKHFAGNNEIDDVFSDAGIKHLMKCPSLEGLALHDCNISEAGVADLATLQKLRYLNLSMTRGMPADAAKSVAKLKNLTHLNLYNWDIGDEGVAHLSGLVNLTHLNLAGSGISNKGLRALTDMKSLTHLTISGAPLKDGVFQELTVLPKLTYLSMHVSKVSDAGLKDINVLPNLTHLDLRFNSQLSDAGVKELRVLKKLELLDLQFASITDASLTELQQITTLKLLAAGGTQVTKAGIEAFKKARPGCSAYGP